MSIGFWDKLTHILKPLSGVTNLFGRTKAGLTPQAPSGNGTSHYLREDGEWIDPIKINKLTILDMLHPVGTIIESTTCDTMAKVVAAYGGTTWKQHTGYILRGASSNVTSNDNSNTGTGFGGSDTETLTGAQSGLKGHGHGFTQPTVNGGATNTGWISADHTHTEYGLTYQFYGCQGNPATADSRGWAGHSGTGTTSGVSANHYHGVPDHTHSVSGGAVTNASASNATSAHSTVQRYKNVYIWERTA